MRAATAIAAVLAAALILPPLAAPTEAVAKTHHHAASSGAAHHGGHAAAHHASGGHHAAGKARGGHAKAGHEKKSSRHERSSRRSRHARREEAAPVAPPAPVLRPQNLSAPSRADRLVLPANVAPSHYDVAIIPDLAHDAFTGKVRIDIEVKSQTRAIVLNAADLAISQASLTTPQGAVLTPKWSLNPKDQTATFTFPSNLKPGAYTFSIAYSGLINATPDGLFHLDYDGPAGRTQALYTQFETTDARRFMPSWDEPERKATFSLTIDGPDGQMAVSNMPQASSERVGEGVRRFHFAQTPKMSSYLLFVGVGDFERVTRQVGETEIGVVVKKGDTERAAYALDSAAQILAYYNDYFGVPYPLPKLDLIAAPSVSPAFSAMENWGAILSFEPSLLVDSKTGSDAARQKVFGTIAHEMAHQWFGDLVTPDWWDDIWLNEGFATWMARKAQANLHPDWEGGLSALTARSGAMDEDALSTSHAVVQHVRDGAQAAGVFDAITYTKGAAVLGMLESYVGEERFRYGVQTYIKNHAFGTAVTDDLWKEIDAAGLTKITSTAHDFTLQPGVPLITASPQGGGAQISQSRYGLEEDARRTLRWDTPVVTARAYGGGAWKGLVATIAPASLKAPVDGLIVNAGQSGYYRTLYTGALFTHLTEAYARLTPADQLGVLLDVGALSRAGYQPMGDLLTLIDKAGGDLDPAVAQGLVDRLADLATLERGLAGETAFKAFARKKLAPYYDRLGFDAHSDDAAPVLALRQRLVHLLADLGDPKVIETAREHYGRLKTDPSSLAAEDRALALWVTARTADPALFNELRDKALASTDTLEKIELFALMGQAQDETLARQALDIAFQPGTPKAAALTVMLAVADLHPDLAVDFALAHPGELRARLEPTAVVKFLPRLAAGSSDPDMAAKLERYAQAEIPATGRQRTDAAKARIALNRRLKTERAPEIDRWLALRGKDAPQE